MSDWVQTEKTCPVHGGHAGDALWHAVGTENRTRSRVLQILSARLGIDHADLEVAGVTVAFGPTSGVDGRPILVDGLRPQDVSAVKAACDAEFGVDVVSVG